MSKITATIIDKEKYYQNTGHKPKKKTVQITQREAEILVSEGIVGLSPLAIKMIEKRPKKKNFLPIEEKTDDEWKIKKTSISVQYNRKNPVPGFPWEFFNFEADLHITSGIESKVSLDIMTPWYNEDGETGISFFDDPRPRGKKFRMSDSIIQDFFEFQTEYQGKKIIILSRENIVEPFVNIRGILSHLQDEKKVGDKTTLRTRKSILIATSISRPQISQEKIKKALEIKDTEALRSAYFGVFRQPIWFENLILAWNICSSKDYPLHLLTGDTESENEHQGGFGKSSLFSRIQKINGRVSSNGEPDVFDGTESTSKGLIPSNKGERLDPGYLLSCPFTACVDELFSLFTQLDREAKMKELGERLTSLLEHLKRIAKSGNTPATRINPTFRAFMSGNLPPATNDLDSLLQKFHSPMVARTIPYFYNEEHRNFIESNRVRVQKDSRDGSFEDITIDLSDWLYYSSKVRLASKDTIEERMKGLVKDTYSICKKGDINPILKGKKLASFYEKRFAPHHIHLILDGVVKIQNLPSFQTHLENCIQSNDFKEWVFEPTDNDYSMVSLILGEVIRSWVS